jgi:hypothetical protein
MTTKFARTAASVAVLLFALAEANAQFTSSGGNTTTPDNVAIGLTTAPQAKLHVFGAVTTSSSLFKATSPNSDPYGVLITETLATEGYGSGTVVQFTGNSLIRVSNLQIGYVGYPLVQSQGTQPLYLNRWSNNDVIVGQSVFPTGFRVQSVGPSSFAGGVGIGTTTPGSQLHILGNNVPDTAQGDLVLSRYWASATDVRASAIFHYYDTPTTSDMLVFGVTGDWSGGFTRNKPNQFSQAKMVIKASGNVGIGTTNPAQKLSVVGTVESTSGGFKFPDGTIQSTAFAASSGVLSLNGVTPQYVLTSTNSTQKEILSTSGAGLFIDVTGHATPSNNIVVFRTTNVASSFTPVEAMRVTSNGNVEIGGQANDSVKLNVNGNANINGTLTATSVFNAVYGQDVAEWVRSDRELAAGTVVVVRPGKTNEVMPSITAYDTTVAGVVSAQPGVILGRPGALKATVATSGRVRVHVDARKGAIRVGDLLVTSDEAGTAMKSQPIEVGGRKFHQPGTILGKALEPLDDGVGDILVLLCLG